MDSVCAGSHPPSKSISADMPRWPAPTPSGRKAIAPAPSVPELDQALGARIEYLGRTAFDYVVQLDSAAAVRSLNPDMTYLARLPARGVVVTAAGDDGEHDFVSRFFAPQSGVPEDPVTGSAHCGLGPFWGA